MRPLTFLALCLCASPAGAQTRLPIDRADQLPVHTYAIGVAPSELVHDAVALGALLEPLRRDLETDLAAYDIRDAAALRSYYRALEMIAVLQGHAIEARENETRARALEEKPAQRLLSGYLTRPLLVADSAASGNAAQAFSIAFASELQRLPYDSVEAELRAEKGRLQALSVELYEALATRGVDETVARPERISKDRALRLVRLGWAVQRVLPYRDEAVRQLSAIIAAHEVEKADIWTGRDVSLDGHAGLTPVVIAISDGGVDASLFPGRMWTNSTEIRSNGRDDDGNGYVDDVHGTGWDWNGAPVTGDLPPVPFSADEFARARQNAKGFLDLAAGLDSEDAQAARSMLAGLPRERVKRVLEARSFYSKYAHGTHVAGIAVRGNPAARILVLRLDEPYQSPGPPWTAARAEAIARSMERSIDYYRKAGVRVVNMSWIIIASGLERNLEVQGVGASQEERRRLAFEYYDTIKAAFGAAIARASDILFVSGAGNDNASNQFDEGIPAAFDYPNTITVGAVDRGGAEAKFTSFGKVDIYANGYEIESLVPGGDRERRSGTSMASPQVVNLAAKLLAVHPTLSAVEIKRLILEGADQQPVGVDRSIRLLNPTRSFQLAAAQLH